MSRPRQTSSTVPPSPMPRWVVYAVAGATFFDISTIHHAIPGLASLRPQFLLLGASLVGLGLNTRVWRPADIQRSRFFRYTGVVLFIAIIGIPFAVVSMIAVRHLTDTYIKILIQATMIWAVCRHERDRLILVRAVTAALLVACMTGLVGARGDGGRLQGLYTYDANSLALLANIALPLLGWYWMDKRNRWRWLAIAALPVPLLTLVLSGSRGGFLSFAAMGASTVLLVSHRAPRPLRRLFPAAIAIGIAGFAISPSTVTERISLLLDRSDYNYTSDGGRMAIWSRGLGYAFSNPITGVGIANFSSAESNSQIARQYAREGRGFVRNVAHSSYVEVIAELGFIGGYAFIGLMVLTMLELLKRTRRGRITGDPDAVYAGIMGVAWVGYSVSIAFLSYAYFPATYILYAITYGYLDQLGGRAEGQRVQGRPGRLRARPKLRKMPVVRRV